MLHSEWKDAVSANVRPAIGPRPRTKISGSSNAALREAIFEPSIEKGRQLHIPVSREMVLSVMSADRIDEFKGGHRQDEVVIHWAQSVSLFRPIWILNPIAPAR
jgi:hypothetical protein